MREKPTSNQTLGLSLNSSELKGVELTLLKGKPKLKKIFKIKTTAENGHVKPLYNGDQKKLFQVMLEKNLVSTSLDTSDVLVRPLKMKLKKEKDIDAVLAFQAEPLFPYPADKALFDYIVLEKQEESTNLTVLSVRKELLENHLGKWKSVEVEPEVVSCVPAALASFSEKFASTENMHIVCCIGQDETTCCLVEKGKLIHTQNFHKGLNFLTKGSQGEGFPEDFQTEADKEVLNKLEILRLEIVKIVFALEKQARRDNLEILYTGEGAAHTLVVQFLNEKLGKEKVELLNDPLFPADLSKLHKYAVPLGTALSTLNTAENKINFRMDEFSYPHPWKRIKKPVITYLALCFLLAFSIYLFGKAYTENERTELKKDYVDLLEFTKKPYQTFEKQAAANKDSDIKTPIELTQSEIMMRLGLIEKEIKKSPDVYPLLPNVPRVSDVLAWLSSHPNIKIEGEEDDLLPKMNLEGFSYKMVKFPDQKKKKENYSVKVDLEFTTPVPRYAREFHDALRVPNEIVDEAGGIKWTAEEGRYKASFFLKDKTVYPK